MKGYLAFPPPSLHQTSPTRVPKPEPIGTCIPWSNQSCHDEQAIEERRKRREQERTLGERSEIEWVRAGGVLRDALGRRDKARTERIRQELATQDTETRLLARWEVYEARWRAIQNAIPSSLTFVEFPWPLGERVTSRDLGPLTRRAVSEFLLESLAVRTNTTTKRERIRSALLRWHPDKISSILSCVVQEDLELVWEGIHIVFGILKELQDSRMM